MSETTPLAPPPESQLRDDIARLMLGDLRGPLSGDPREELTERPSMRYILGALAPQQESLEPEKDEDLAGSDEDDEGEQGPAESKEAARPVLLPSSMGLSFAVERACKALAISVRWGRYERMHSESLLTDKGNPRLVWKRASFEATSPPVPLAQGAITPWSPDPDRAAIEVRGRVRESGDTWLVTLFLVNAQTRLEDQPDHAWLFQCELEVCASDGTAAIVRRTLPVSDPARTEPLARQEELELAMLYRHVREFAVGHGVGAEWSEAPGDRSRALTVRTESAPSYDVPRVDAVTATDEPALGGLELDMETLASLEGHAFAGALAPLADTYERWIERQRERVATGADEIKEHGEAARGALGRCGRALERIREGVALLVKGGIEAEAFRVANAAMALQRQRARVMEERRRSPEGDPEVAARRETDGWRPFQLAFMLLNLAAISDLHHADRCDPDAAAGDLLWFPTGGGKTIVAAHAVGVPGSG